MLSSFSIEETNAMDKNLCSLLKGMPLVEGYLLSNYEIDGYLGSEV